MHLLRSPTLKADYDRRILRSGPLAYWPLDSKGSGAFVDLTGNGFDLAIPDQADWTIATTPSGVNYAYGDGALNPVFTAAAAVDGLHVYNGGSWTIEAWVYLFNSAANQHILTNGPSGGAGGASAWSFYRTASEEMVMQAWTTGSANYSYQVTAALGVTTWTHVVVSIVSGGMPTIYLNTVASSSASMAPSGTPRPPSSHRLYFGVLGDGSGDLDSTTILNKLAIYNRQLSNQEIADHHISLVNGL